MEESVSTEDVRRYAAAIDASIDEGTASAIAEQFVEQDAVLESLAELADPDTPDRDYWKPESEDDPLGAYLTRCDVGPISGSGPLSGMRVAVKDNIAVAGVPMTCGSPLLEEQSFVPSTDATAVRRLLEGGARIVGKTNMDEFAFGGDRSTMRLRLAHNPHDHERMPGSSSAGSGIVAATGEVDLALGTDTGGSIRFPAAWSGVPGIKPTRGLVSHHGFVQYAKTLDNVGLLAPTVENLALGLDAIAGEDPFDERTRGRTPQSYADAVDDVQSGPESGLTIGLPEELFGNAPKLDEVTRAALEQLEDEGAELRQVSIPDYEWWLPAWLGIGMTEVGAYLRSNGVNHWLLSDGDPALAAALSDSRNDEAALGDALVTARLYAEHLNDAHDDRYYILAHRARRRLAKGIDEALTNIDVLASTTVPMLAPRWDEEIEDVFGALSNTGPFNVSGHPGVSVPCGTVEELPVGLQFVAPHFDDATALAAAARWSSTYDWERPAYR